MPKGQWWRGLLARLTLAYTIGALVLSGIVAVFSFTTAQTRLLTEEQVSARNLFAGNVREVRRKLSVLPPNSSEEQRQAAYADLVSTLRRSNGSVPLIISPSGQNYGPLSPDVIPVELKSAIAEEQLAQLRFERMNEAQEVEPVYAVGIGLADLDTEYYEIRSLADLDKTMTDLGRILFAAAGLASIAGAGLGYYSARRAVSPVTRISNAARAIAAGDFKTRLDLQVDPDLEVLSQSFNDMVDALGARIERDARFASDVSHELRSPLMTLTASLEVLERRMASMPEVVQRAVLLLRQDLTRFERLVEDLLEISRMDAGAVTLQTSTFALGEFLVNVITQSRSPQIELQHDERDRRLRVSADKRRLAQVMTNLIENANKYAGGATAITFAKVGSMIRIAVEDEGPGVPVEDRDRIFDRFSRISSDAGRRATDSGVGLGLSLVSEHVRLHGGRVWVEERLDGRPGARFVVELPEGDDDDIDEEMAI